MKSVAFPGSRMGSHIADTATVGGLNLVAGGGGLVVGRSRQQEPVGLRLFRAEPTRLLLTGGVRCAELLAFRALAIGARLFIQTAREQEWDSFLRRCVIGRDVASFLPPGVPPPTAASPTEPQLIVIDTGPVTGPDSGLSAPWRATLVVRDDLAGWDVEALVRSDIVLLQRLVETEAATAASALGLASVQSWFTQLHPEMVGLITKGKVQWVMLSMTPTERQLIGPVARAG
ncbi:hypothetical protein GA0070606_2656 [Micromonospora citrea]|uniref:Uncharacterized protein n=1 Tax=Micromonospora citrea TaxID=47855 RepID=A0A1C6US13_9ACTN|nr:hypothetical protein [Micromonospora citrea]SCL56730.1 hypothetical protein GA0070606_2656 [Micromonospora citrea]